MLHLFISSSQSHAKTLLQALIHGIVLTLSLAFSMLQELQYPGLRLSLAVLSEQAEAPPDVARG